MDAVRAHLLELAGDRDGAVRHYRSAAGKTGSLPERNYLLTQAARLSKRAATLVKCATLIGKVSGGAKPVHLEVQLRSSLHLS
jgi:hypothetical protein